jgi:Ca2+-binding EF-hand superfamily protein
MNDNKMLYSIMAGIDEDHDGTINFEEFLKISLTKFSEINSRKEAA